MQIKLDRQVDMAYLSLVPIADGQVAYMEALIIDLPGGARRLVNLDFDEEGRLLGIEFDGASAILPEALLRQARSGDIGARRTDPRGTHAAPMSLSVRDVADYPFSLRNARWRTWLRAHTPNVLYYRLGLVVPKARDCGSHEWYNGGDRLERCYHCEATRSTPPDAVR